MTTTPTIWRNEFTANPGNTAGTQFDPQSIGLANGNILVVWRDNGSAGPDNDIFGQIFDALGNAIGDAFQVNETHFSQGDTNPVIAALPDGGFIFAYIDDNDAVADEIVIERYNASGARVFFTSITGGAGAVSDPSITVAADGDYVVTFTRNIAGDSDVRAVRFDGATNVAGAEFDHAQNSADIDRDAEVAGLSNNNTVAVYEEFDAGVSGIEFQIRNSAGTFIDSGTVTSTGSDPDVAALANGGFVVVYNDPANGGDIRFSIFDNLGNPAVEEVLIIGGADAENEPKVVALQDGGFFVVWDNDTLDGLQGRRFDEDGTAVGAPIIIATDGVFSVQQPELGLTADGRILVTFQNGDGEISEVILDPRDNVINGTNASEVITTQSGDTTLDAFGGNDTVFGRNGDNSIGGGSGADSIVSGNGNDTVSGASGNDTANGGNDNDLLIGGTGDDRLIGGNGNDMLRGEADRDTLTGNAGNDRFDFNNVSESLNATRDVITDFVHLEDRIDVNTIDAQATPAGNQNFVFIGDAAFTAEGQIRAVQSGGGAGPHTIIQINTTGNGGAEMVIQLSNFDASTLTDDDFIL